MGQTGPPYRGMRLVCTTVASIIPSIILLPYFLRYLLPYRGYKRVGHQAAVRSVGVGRSVSVGRYRSVGIGRSVPVGRSVGQCQSVDWSASASRSAGRPAGRSVGPMNVGRVSSVFTGGA